MKNFLLVLSVLTFSCQSGQENEIKELKEQVMALHDEVMPKMSELRYTRKDLLLQADSLQNSDSARAASLSAAADAIDAANDGMRKWMQNFQPDFQGTEEEVLKYLMGQKEAIQTVKDDMENSLLNGKEELARD